MARATPPARRGIVKFVDEPGGEGSAGGIRA
jgi:hypothetical protein